MLIFMKNDYKVPKVSSYLGALYMFPYYSLPPLTVVLFILPLLLLKYFFFQSRGSFNLNTILNKGMER